MRLFFHCFQLDKVRAAYHKSCQKEQAALDKEKQANEDSEMSPEKKQKLANTREKATGEKLKVSSEVTTVQVFKCFMTGARKLNVLHLNADLLTHYTCSHLIRQL